MYTHDGASAKISTNSHEPDNSVGSKNMAIGLRSPIDRLYFTGGVSYRYLFYRPPILSLILCPCFYWLGGGGGAFMRLSCWCEGSKSFCNFYPAQVHLTEEKSGEVAAAPPPEVQYLDISWQKNLLEEARIGITTIHQVKNTANFK